MQLLNSMADTAKNNQQPDLSKQLLAQLNNYEGKFAGLMR